MAIYLRTGVGGAGKTILTIEEILKLQKEFPERNVYYFNLTLLPEHEMYEQVKSWNRLSSENLQHELPLLLNKTEDGSSDYENLHPAIKHSSIILIDEAQDLYPSRTGSQKVPEYLKFFERHRHAGLDFYIISQKPRQIDKHLRELVNEHIHYERAFGIESVKQIQSNKVIEDLNKADESHTISRRKYPKKLYGLYQSSVLHTHKRKLPKKLVIVAPLLLVSVIGLFYFVFTIFENLMGSDPKTENQQVIEETTGKPSPFLASNSASPNLFQILDNLEFLYEIKLNDSINAFFLLKKGESETIFDLLALKKMGFNLVRIDKNIYLSSKGFVIKKRKIKTEQKED